MTGHDDHEHLHDEHEHRGGVLGTARHLLAAHHHDHAASIDTATAHREGMRG